jgi:hypothetical protein
MRIFSMMILITSILIGCEQEVNEPVDKSVRFSGMHGTITIVTDNETGCRYLRERYGQGVGLTPLLKSDGKPDCQ